MRPAAVILFVLRHYGAWIGLILAWAVIALAVGHADAVRLVAASAFVRAARYLTAARTLPFIRKQLRPGGALDPRAIRIAFVVEAVALLAAAVFVLLVAALLTAVGQQRTAFLCLLLLVGLPPRFMLWLGARKRPFLAYRFAATWGGLALVLIAWLLHAPLPLVALAFALREWLALAIAPFLAPRFIQNRPPRPPLPWRYIAARSAAAARRRLSYRIGKSLLSMALGPLGGMAARAARGARLHHKLDRFTPQDPRPILLLALSAAGASVAIILLAPTPATLVAAASLLAVGCVAASVLGWSALAQGQAALASEEEDEDED